MIEFSELKPGDVVYTILYVGGAYKVTWGEFQEIGLDQDIGCAMVQLNEGRKISFSYPESLYRTREEAELNAVIKALSPAQVEVANITRCIWFSNPTQVKVYEHNRRKLAHQRLRLRRLL